jgi:hypothetical protein
MVVEMTSLQGIMGREYALRSGEQPEVAEAIGEHYQPRASGDDLPATLPGITLALADRLDSLIGLFSVGMEPTGSADPFGLRRAALGIVLILVGHAISVDLRQLVEWAAMGYTQELGANVISDEARKRVLDFIAGRLRVVLRVTYPHDVVEAVLGRCLTILIAPQFTHSSFRAGRQTWIGKRHSTPTPAANELSALNRHNTRCILSCFKSPPKRVYTRLINKRRRSLVQTPMWTSSWIFFSRWSPRLTPSSPQRLKEVSW